MNIFKFYFLFGGFLLIFFFVFLITFTYIFRENNEISIYNNGKGIPVVMHSVEKMYVPEMIFGTLLTSSNYNDSEKKVTGGRNGYGAKLCNIFSTKFVLETSSKEYQKKFKQVSGFELCIIEEIEVI